MKQVVLAGFNWTFLTNIALVIFMTLFIGILIWSFRKDSSKIYKEASEMPLVDEGESYESK